MMINIITFFFLVFNGWQVFVLYISLVLGLSGSTYQVIESTYQVIESTMCLCSILLALQASIGYGIRLPSGGGPYDYLSTFMVLKNNNMRQYHIDAF